MIHVECDPDFTIVKSLTRLPKRQIIHHPGKFEVSKVLAGSNGNLALIDEDPGKNQPFYLKNLSILRDLPQFALKLLIDTEKANKVILLCPRLEEWLIDASKQVGIDLNAFGLSSDLHKLKKLINSRLNNLAKLIDELRAQSDRVKQLESLLRP